MKRQTTVAKMNTMGKKGDFLLMNSLWWRGCNHRDDGGWQNLATEPDMRHPANPWLIHRPL